MANRKPQRSSLAALASAAVAGRLNEVRNITSAHRAAADDDDGEDDGLAPKECPKCDYVNQVTSRYCSKCGTKLDKDDSDASAHAAKRINTRSRLIVEQAKAIDAQAKAIDALNRQVEAIERRSTGGIDLSIFSKRELAAYGLAPANHSAFVRVPGSSETALGLITPEQARAVLEGQSRGASMAPRRAR